MQCAVDAGMLGSIDANRGDYQNGWDTDQFPIDLYEMVQAMMVIVRGGGLQGGGTNFDAKTRRNYVDPEIVKRVEILRGAVPALYGSDGMGGLVNFITVQPDDLLKDGKSIGGRVSASYDGSDNGKRVGATIAGRASPEWSWLVSAGMGASSFYRLGCVRQWTCLPGRTSALLA